jgi:hypothetical protein
MNLFKRIRILQTVRQGIIQSAAVVAKDRFELQKVNKPLSYTRKIR